MPPLLEKLLLQLHQGVYPRLLFDELFAHFVASVLVNPLQPYAALYRVDNLQVLRLVTDHFCSDRWDVIFSFRFRREAINGSKNATYIYHKTDGGERDQGATGSVYL